MDNATYAVVDMSKKKRHQKSPVNEDTSYSVINPQYNSRNSLPDNTVTVNTESIKADKEEANNIVKKASKHASVKFVFIIVTIVVLALVMLIVTAVLFVNLKNQNDSLRQQLSLSQVQSQQQASFSSSEFQILRNQTFELLELFHQLSNNTNTLSDALVGQHFLHPAVSCAALPPSSPSGYYWVKASNGSAVRVYCDMTRSCGRVTGGWMRVANLDYTKSGQQCPHGFIKSGLGLLYCKRDNSSRGCSKVEFRMYTFNYSRICGRVIGKRFKSLDAFTGGNISTNYVDGVSLTHGTPKQHIWTFAAASKENQCPCNQTTGQQRRPPAIVGNDYFCDTRNLWNGVCSGSSACCSFNSPPWFHKQLPQPTTNDIEMRICRNEERDNEDVLIQIVEIYVQ